MSLTGTMTYQDEGPIGFRTRTQGGEPVAVQPDTAYYYKLSTEFRGPGTPLDVYNGGPLNTPAA